jgi:hypothetical protein
MMMGQWASDEYQETAFSNSLLGAVSEMGYLLTPAVATSQNNPRQQGRIQLSASNSTASRNPHHVIIPFW